MMDKKSESDIDVFSDTRTNSSLKTNGQDYSVQTNSMPLGSVSMGSSLVQNPTNKIDSLKTWSVSTYKCTKQIIQEKLGKATKTVDIDLEIRIEKLREVQKNYQLLQETNAKQLKTIQDMVENHRLLAEQMSELGQHQPMLVVEFDKNASLQRVLVRQGEHLIHALTQFGESLGTLISKTMSDTLLTVRKFETARLEYDAYRHELAELARVLKATDPAGVTRQMELRQSVQDKLTLYERLRADVDVKIKFLEENKNRVMHRQLVLLNHATLAFYTGNRDMVESSIDQFRLSMKNSNTQPPSWLENSSSQPNNGSA